MNTRRLKVITLAAAMLTGAGLVAAQAPAETADKPKKERVPKKPRGTFFESEEPIAATFTTNIKQLRRDKADKAPWRDGQMSYTAPDGKVVSIPAKVRTRGIWRLKTCEFPPVRFNFTSAATKGTLLDGLDKPKLVNHCRDDDLYEQYILQELQVYRIYALLTPVSHRVRLLRLTYADSATGKPLTTRYSFFVEDLAWLAGRKDGLVLPLKGAVGSDLEPFHNALIGVFMFFIGNTDFSINGLHNVELVQTSDGIVFPVAFDFDFSGAVNARYATVDPSLSVQRVRDRLFRGYCAPSGDFEKVFALFNEKREAINGLYRDHIGKLMNAKVADETIRFYDDFYKTINDPRARKRHILEACRPDR
ncbi:MAG: hypothetical protein H0T48_16040 [Gemmatimonadaceae bacterium]|nr:hypothetical protein [Gemmatimonadaceae bacterium]